MSGLTGAIHTSLSGLKHSTAGLSTTSHNIANVNTPGFARQQVNASNSRPVPTMGGYIGTGVRTDSVTAYRDRFIETRLNQETSSQSRYETLSSGLQRLETVFNESSTSGLGASINAFFNSFADVASRPTSGAARATLVERGETLATNFRATAERLQGLRQEANRSISGTVAEINSLARQIGELNTQIYNAEAGGQAANDLRDQRGAALQELAQMVDVSTYEDDGGVLTVSTATGRTLVNGSFVKEMEARPGAGGLNQIFLNDTDVTGEINNGRLAGLLALRDNDIVMAQRSLDDIAATVTAEVNAVHSAGYGLDGSTGTDFFTPFVPSGADNSGAAQDFAVDAAIVSDPNKIAAASAAGVEGDNTNALALGNLQNQSFTVTDGSGTFSQLYSAVVGRAGALARDAQQNSKIQEALVAQVQGQRDAVSGVSLDEEAVNLLKYQRSFEAAARVIQVIDRLTEEMVNLVR